jgi:hypothetical protein
MLYCLTLLLSCDTVLAKCRRCPWALLLPISAALLSLMLQTAAGTVTIAGKLECPQKSTRVKPGTDLYNAVKHPDRTYLLAPGSYTVSDTITLQTFPDHPAAYCIIGHGKEPAAVHLKVTGTTSRSPAFRVHAHVSIGLKKPRVEWQRHLLWTAHPRLRESSSGGCHPASPEGV